MPHNKNLLKSNHELVLSFKRSFKSSWIASPTIFLSLHPCTMNFFAKGSCDVGPWYKHSSTHVVCGTSKLISMDVEKVLTNLRAIMPLCARKILCHLPYPLTFKVESLNNTLEETHVLCDKLDFSWWILLGFSHKTWASSSDKSLTTKTMNYNTMGIKKKLGGYSIVEDFPFALLIPILNSEIRFP